MVGRPSKFTEELANNICEIISTSDRGLRSICEELKISTTSVLKWLKENEQFSIQYAHAREMQADFLADLIIEVAKEDRITEETTILNNAKGEVSEQTTRFDNHNRSRLEVDALKWKASKLNPKKYGNKIDVNGEIDNVTTVKVVYE